MACGVESSYNYCDLSKRLIIFITPLLSLDGLQNTAFEIISIVRYIERILYSNKLI